jgi:hypothetical protein
MFRGFSVFYPYIYTMKKLLFIISFLLVAFVISCGIFRNSKSVHYGEGSGSGGDVHRDSISITLPVDSEVVSELQNHHVTLTSGEGWYPKPPDNPKLKIVTINNTKVINKSVNMSDGRVVYKIPEQMKVRSTYRVLLRIAKSKATVSVYDSLEGTVRTSEIPVTQTMSARLIDASPSDNKSFDIVPNNSEIQIVENGETFTEWVWDVTPIKTGSSNLKIVISIIKGDNRKDIIYEDSVMVELNPSAQLLFWWNTYWQWIIGTFLLPFFLWVYKRYKDKKIRHKTKRPYNAE